MYRDLSLSSGPGSRIARGRILRPPRAPGGPVLTTAGRIKATGDRTPGTDGEVLVEDRCVSVPRSRWVTLREGDDEGWGGPHRLGMTQSLVGEVPGANHGGFRTSPRPTDGAGTIRHVSLRDDSGLTGIGSKDLPSRSKPKERPKGRRSCHRHCCLHCK